MINRVVLVGRITKDIDLRKTPNGASVVQFTIACNRRVKQQGQPEADFINCVAWRNTADFISKFFDKGQLIALVGSLQSRTYEDKTGAKRTAFEVIVDEAHFVESKRDSSRPSTPEFKAPPVTGGNTVDFEEVQDDELPF